MKTHRRIPTPTARERRPARVINLHIIRTTQGAAPERSTSIRFLFARSLRSVRIGYAKSELFMRRATFCVAVLVTALAPALALAPTPTSPRRTVPLRAHALEPPRANDAISAAPSSEVVRVELGDRAYDIVIGDGVLTADVAFAAALLRPHVKGAHVLVVSNVVVAPLYLNACVDALRYDGTLRVESLVLPDGEATKSLENLALIVDEALAKALDRKTTFVALGGGVIRSLSAYRWHSSLQYSGLSCCRPLRLRLLGYR